MATQPTVLRFEDVSVHFDDAVALDHVSFEIAGGESRIVYGIAGSGKTTLLKAALGLVKADGAFSFPAPTQHAQVVFALFKQDNAYFPPAQKAMINLQVDDLDGVLDRLIDEGVTVDPKRESYDFGKFGWITDPEGNRVELWQPVATE